jgi:hypothetical protein
MEKRIVISFLTFVFIFTTIVSSSVFAITPTPSVTGTQPTATPTLSPTPTPQGGISQFDQWKMEFASDPGMPKTMDLNSDGKVNLTDFEVIRRKLFPTPTS